MRTYVLILFCLLGITAGLAATTVPAGNVSGTWNTTGSPYLVTGDLVISTGQTLIIQPGVQVLFQGYHRITVSGSLKAIGAAEDSIRFSTSSDSQKWRGLILENISADNDSTLISRCIFERGDATLDPENKNGGALRILNCPKLRIEHSRFQYMSADYGGALYLQAADYKVTNCIFKNCNATITGGAVLKAESPTGYNSGSLNLSGCLFANNSASDTGGSLCSINGEIYLRNSTFLSSAAFQGGAIAFTYCSGAITNCLIKGNLMGTAGAGIFVRSSSVLISENTIQNNYWSSDYNYPKGAGIYCLQSTCNIIGNYIANNSSFSNGGGISLNDSTFNVLNNLIVNNSTSQRGGGIFTESWVPGCLIANNTIANNTCGAYAGGGLQLVGAVNVKNNIVWGNTGGNSQINVLTDGSSQFFDYNCLQGGIASLYAYPNGNWQASQWGMNNVEGNPAFVSPSAGAGTGFNGLTANWNIQSTSSCYNTGDPATDTSLYPSDLAGNMRVSETIIDIGAYEFMSPSVPRTPQNLRIIHSVGNNAILRWDLVTMAIDGSPINVSTYKIYYAPLPEGPWTFLGYGTNGQSAIPAMNNPEGRRFYRITAFIPD